MKCKEYSDVLQTLILGKTVRETAWILTFFATEASNPATADLNARLASENIIY